MACGPEIYLYLYKFPLFNKSSISCLVLKEGEGISLLNTMMSIALVLTFLSFLEMMFLSF